MAQKPRRKAKEIEGTSSQAEEQVTQQDDSSYDADNETNTMFYTAHSLGIMEPKRIRTKRSFSKE